MLGSQQGFPNKMGSVHSAMRVCEASVSCVENDATVLWQGSSLKSQKSVCPQIGERKGGCARGCCRVFWSPEQCERSHGSRLVQLTVLIHSVSSQFFKDKGNICSKAAWLSGDSDDLMPLQRSAITVLWFYL